MLLRSSWGGNLSWHLYSLHREAFWGISPSIYNLGIDFDVDEKAKPALLDLDRDIKIEPTSFKLDNDIRIKQANSKSDGDTKTEPVYFELDTGANIKSAKVELDGNIQAEQVNYEIDRVTKIEPINFELNSDVKAKSVELLTEFQILLAGNDANVAVESSPQISDINANVLTTSLKTQSETDKQFPNSSLIPFIDLSSPKISARRLFTPLLDLIDEPGSNSTPFQDIFPSSDYFNSLIKNISTLFDPSLLKSQSLSELAGAFENPDHIFKWSRLALDYATSSTAGPTPSSRLFALLTTSMWDAWAVFEDKATGSIYYQDKQDDFIALLESFEISDKDLAGFKALYKYSTNTVKEILEHAVRHVAMDVSAFNVLSEIQSSLFKDGIPDDLAGTSEELLSKNLASTGELLSIDRVADLVISIGTKIGEKVSSGINQFAKKDNSNQLGFYADTTGYSPSASVYNSNDPDTLIDSSWQPLEGQIALTQQWGGVTPFAIAPDLLIPSSILTPYTESGELNTKFISELTLVRDKRQTLTPMEKAIAEYYEGGPLTATPPGLWFKQQIDESSRRKLDLDQSLKLAFGVTQAMFDAGIATWKVKNFFDSVRPVTAIRQYEPDKVLNDEGLLARDWSSFLPTPNFQENPSGHSSFSAASNFMFIKSFGSNVFDFSVTLEDDDSQYSEFGFDGDPDSMSDIVISATYFTEAAAQAGDSRIYGGIHIKDGDLKGQIIGITSAAYVSQKIESLELGLPLEEVSSLPLLSFGTMQNDILTGLSLEDYDKNSVQKIYGFDGEDTFVAKGSLPLEVYGGSGKDTFLIYETGTVSLRDYESMEKIELDAAIFEAGETIGDIQFNISATEPFTDVSLDGYLLFRMDGYWSSDDVSLSILA